MLQVSLAWYIVLERWLYAILLAVTARLFRPILQALHSSPEASLRMDRAPNLGDACAVPRRYVYGTAAQATLQHR